MPKKTAEISSMYQCWVTRPHTMMPMPMANTASTPFWRPVKGCSMASSETENSRRLALSSS